HGGMVIQSCFASCGSLFVADKCCHLGRPGGPIGEHHAVTLLAAVSELNYVEAIRSALAFEMDRDERVMVLGLDVGRLGGVFRATQGLLERFGADRTQTPGVKVVCPAFPDDARGARPGGVGRRLRAATRPLA